ncbi:MULTISPECIES: NAD(P)-dependent alcohol dehydrogenase [unclassified Streptomyces]|uniref:NAD(P)-dependent alcohol dehydrogenase n=1 Tax=unclassified Streptomyces TaxID=2593676 RepID=UPI002E80E1A0|nr:NAD(P)-dependent alcohol dehydrogenase [Streptomyces sp. NBC_00562]WUC17477.1 NAD(P)-dependent alcohol dehydrogenase [Streptomyces sp. NBC_00562]WUC25190.1 NAD(P)-dependent alcohol dehydrogenase [Streptomyces sp. NBC_00562]
MAAAEGSLSPQTDTGSGSSTIPVTAAVVRQKGGPFTFEDLTLDTVLRPDEVLVKVVATGLCQTDIHVRDQALPTPLPVVLGHEGAGIVERVGDAVSTVTPGDRVVMSYQACGHCTPCLSGNPGYCALSFPANFGGSRLDGTNALHAGDEEIHGHFFGQSSFATHALATERNVVKVDDEDIPLELLSPLGCGLQTGAGAVLNSLKIEAGASVVIIGAGTVGLAAVMAAKVAGASPVIAVDIVPERLDLARELGATHTVNGKEEDTAARIAELTRGGADYVLEITARPEMLTLAVDALAPLGTAALIGGAPAGAHAPVNMNALLGGRTVRGIAQGDSIPQLFIPQLIDLYRAGRFPFDRLITFYGFDQINEAATDTRTGAAIKPVLRMGE